MWKSSSYISVTWRYESLGILSQKIPVQLDVHGSPLPQFLSLLEGSTRLALIALRAFTTNIRETIFSSNLKYQRSIWVGRMEMHTHLNRCQQEPVSSYTAYLFCEIPNAYLNMVCIIKRPHFSSCLWIAFDWSRLLLITGSTIMVYNTITYASCNRNLVCWQLNKRMRSKMGSAKLYVMYTQIMQSETMTESKQSKVCLNQSFRAISS